MPCAARHTLGWASATESTVTIPSTKLLLLSYALLFGAACDRMTTPLQGNPSDSGLPPDLADADLTSPQPPCLAAKGIAGTLLKELSLIHI